MPKVRNSNLWFCEVKRISETKKGHVKITLEAEINGELMDLLKDGMQNMPHMIQQAMAQRKKE
jgi:hypothetical protein